MDLPQPGIHRTPGVIHRHRPLGDGGKGEVVQVLAFVFQRRVPDGQRVAIARHPRAQRRRRLAFPMPFRREAEFLQGLRPDLQDHLIGVGDQPHRLGAVQIGLVGVLEPLLFGRQVIAPEAAIVDVALQLVGVRLAEPLLAAIRPAEAGQRADAGRTLMVHDVVRVVLEARGAILLHEGRQAQPRAEFDQHILEGPDIAIRRDHRLADGIARAMRAADRAIQHGNAVPPLQIGGVGQDQVGIGHGLGKIGVRVDDVRNVVAAIGALIREDADHLGRVHGAVPGHVGHEHEQRVDRIGIIGPGIADDRVHHPMQAERRFPGKGLVDPQRRARLVHQQIVRPLREGEDIAGERGIRFRALAGRRRAGRDRPREGRFVAPGPGGIDRPQQHLHQVQGAAGVKAVGMGGDAAHRVKRDRPPDGLRMRAAPDIRPGLVQHQRLVEGDIGDFGGDPADGLGRYAAPLGHRLGGVFGGKVAFGQQLEDRHRHAAIGQLPLPDHDRRKIGQRGIHRPARPIPGKRLALRIAREQPVIGAAGRRWCSGRGIPDRPDRSAAVHAPGRARRDHRCPAGCRSIRRPRQNSRCGLD